MFVGNCMYMGVKDLVSKKGVPFRLVRLADMDTGETMELFAEERLRIPAGTKVFEEVEVTLAFNNRGFRVEGMTFGIPI